MSTENKKHAVHAIIEAYAANHEISLSYASRLLSGSSRLYNQLDNGGVCGLSVEARVKSNKSKAPAKLLKAIKPERA